MTQICNRHQISLERIGGASDHSSNLDCPMCYTENATPKAAHPMTDDKTREEFEASPHNNEHSITSNQVLCEKETGRVVAVFYNDYDLQSVIEQMQTTKEKN